MDAHSLRQIFQPTPGQWGLRGDPYLWQELEQVFAQLQPPADPAAADALLQALYINLVGEAPAPGRPAFVARYAHGGMSSGQVDADFWLTRGFPLLR
ncbi:hypothetical protein Q5H93_06625 [Hymenobacter sp. ASUV-10]|uniref:Uncharacterized protein n=1 Tax=Hymenobacter aranciens TaxID=3063996 RepID=A0ABT9B801_9BACT|nr:hypothetical protein [Hymenobacter sp. ASUV-10]MDO7874401.1 hypothetical protein [Hymenobacter sp. ASUV-10]